MKKEAKSPVIFPEKIFLVDVLILKNSIDSTDGYLGNMVKPEKMRVDFTTESTYDLSKNICRFRLQISLQGQNETELPVGVFADFLFDFIYMIENFQDYIKQNNEVIEIQSILGATLLGISFSTARGIILERTKGTPLAGFLLPIINPTKALFESMASGEKK